jgi:salicylate hydroxylase
MSFLSSLSVGIVGGGIGGLTAAVALAKRGAVVRVYEQASHFAPTAGAAFGLSPNGQVCLESLGVRTRDNIHRFDNMIFIDNLGRIVKESNFFEQVFQRHGFTIGGCIRADLVDILTQLLDKDAIQYSHKVVDIKQDESKVQFQFQKGQMAEHDLLIGADGIHSTVASLLEIDPMPPVYSGANIFYGVIDKPKEKQFENPIVAREHAVISGNVTGEFIMFRAGAGSDPKLIWANTYRSEFPPTREEWDVAERNNEMGTILEKFEKEHPIHELHAHTDRLLHFGLFYRKHKQFWTKGRASLLGDSCHATLPYVGQGANQAIEDAAVLAQCLDTHMNYPNAFSEYFARRSRRTKRINPIIQGYPCVMQCDTSGHPQTVRNHPMGRSRECLLKNEKSEAMKAIGRPCHSSGTSRESGMRFQPSGGLPGGRPD